jgi:hypothetical protein
LYPEEMAKPATDDGARGVGGGRVSCKRAEDLIEGGKPEDSGQAGKFRLICAFDGDVWQIDAVTNVHEDRCLAYKR